MSGSRRSAGTAAGDCDGGCRWAGEELDDVATESDIAERREALDDDVDAILDEIDDVLETNAEDFVKSFIQKGGQ